MTDGLSGLNSGAHDPNRTLTWRPRELKSRGAAAWAVARASLPFDVRRLQDRPPFLNLGPVEGGEGLRRLLVRRENFLT